MLSFGAQGIQAACMQGKGHTDPNHAKMCQGVLEQLPLVFANNCLRSCSSRCPFNHHMAAEVACAMYQALLCVLAVKTLCEQCNSCCKSRDVQHNKPC